MTNTAKIRKLLADGVAPGDIAKRLKVNRQSVYGVRYYDKHKTTTRPVGRPRKVIPTVPKSFWQKLKSLFI